MPIAVNPAGDVVYLDQSGQWVPSKKAVNSQTNETLAFDGSGWVPLKAQTARAHDDWFGFQVVDIKKPGKAAAATTDGDNDWSGFKPIAIGQEPEPQQAEARHDNPIGEGRASAYSAVSQIPIVGAGATKAMAALNAAVPPSLGAPQMSKAGTFGERYSENLPLIQKGISQYQAEHPIRSTLEGLATTGAATAPLAATGLGARLLGLVSGPALKVATASGLSGATISGIDAALRGEDPVQAAKVGGAVGAILPPLGRAAGSLIGAARGLYGGASPAAAELAAASERLGIPVSRIASPDASLLAQRAGAAIKEVPGVGNPLVRASENTISQLGKAAEGVTNQYGSASELTAGEQVKDALKNWITSGSAKINDRLYSAVDGLVNPNLTRPLHSTMQAAGDIVARRMASGEQSLGKAVDLVSGALIQSSGCTDLSRRQRLKNQDRFVS